MKYAVRFRLAPQSLPLTDTQAAFVQSIATIAAGNPSVRNSKWKTERGAIAAGVAALTATAWDYRDLFKHHGFATTDVAKFVNVECVVVNPDPHGMYAIIFGGKRYGPKSDGELLIENEIKEYQEYVRMQRAQAEAQAEASAIAVPAVPEDGQPAHEGATQ